MCICTTIRTKIQPLRLLRILVLIMLPIYSTFIIYYLVLDVIFILVLFSNHNIVTTNQLLSSHVFVNNCSNIPSSYS